MIDGGLSLFSRPFCDFSKINVVTGTFAVTLDFQRWFLSVPVLSGSRCSVSCLVVLEQAVTCHGTLVTILAHLLLDQPSCEEEDRIISSFLVWNWTDSQCSRQLLPLACFCLVSKESLALWFFALLAHCMPRSLY